jgi:hypothetical protein
MSDKDMVKNRFEHDGKTWEAAALPYARLSDGTLLKVIKTDEHGNAQVAVSTKKNPAADEVAVAVEFKAESAAPPEETPEERLAALKTVWREAREKAKSAVGEQAATEAAIAAELLKQPRKRGEVVAVNLGGTNYRAQKSKDGAQPSLVPLPKVGATL